MVQDFKDIIMRHLERIEAEMREGGLYRTVGNLRGITDSLFNHIKRLELYEQQYTRAIDAAIPHLQCGGRYSHLLQIGDDILADGVPALVKALDQALAEAESLQDLVDEWDARNDEAYREALAQGRKEGFEAAREKAMDISNPRCELLDDWFEYASLEHYEESLKEKEEHGD